MKKALFSLLALVFCATGFFPALTKADGIFIPPIDYYVSSTAQKSVIIYEKGTETMVVSTQFRGDAKNFGWIIPVPSRPEVSKSSDELFTSLDTLTAPAYNYKYSAMPMAENESAGRGAAVEVLETKKVGVYEIKVLEASDAQALAKWLEENKYMYPKEGSYILDEYIRNRWYFVAAKIDTAALEALSTTESLKQGHAQPIKIAFKSDKLIYPMKISSLQAALAKKEEQKASEQGIVMPYLYSSDSSEITFYVFADGKKELPGFTTQYAGYVSPKTIKKLAYVEGESWWQPTRRFYLTRLYNTMTFSEMTEDLIFRQADDNKPVNGEKSATSKVINVVLYSFVTVLGWIGMLIGLAFIIFSFVRHYAKSKAIHTLSAVIQWVAFILTGIIALVTVLVYAADGFFSKILEFKDKDIPAVGMMVGGIMIVAVCLAVLLKQRTTSKKMKAMLK